MAAGATEECHSTIEEGSQWTNASTENVSVSGPQAIATTQSWKNNVRLLKFNVNDRPFRSKEEVESEFQEYKATTEQSKGDEQEEMEKLKAELAELKGQHQYEREQLRMQA